MKILLAVDGSEASDAAVQAVRARPWPAGSTIRVLSVVQPVYPPLMPPGGTMANASPYTDASMIEVGRMLEKQAQELTERLAKSLEPTGCKLESVVERGDPRTNVVDNANEWKADLIVLGSHGRTGLKRLFLGSVAESVVRHAACSVEVARTSPNA